MLDPNVFLQNPTPDFKVMDHQLCRVCSEPAAGFHFGVFSCEGCKSFFGRTYNNVSGIAECKNGGRCEINKKNRTSCKSCRLRKCLRVGMSKSGSRYGRRSNWFKIHCLLQAQGQQNGGGIGQSPEANNNNSTVTNNNNSPTNYQSSFGKNQLPSTITSFGSLVGSDHRDRERSDRDEERRERTPSSSASRSAFTGLSSLSPDSLTSLNRKLNSSDLADYFRAAGMSNNNMGKSSSGDERGEDMSRTTTRSPGSLESPRSETSIEDGKSSTPLFTMPSSGSPLEVKPNDLLSFDLLTRDLMKMGYDPLRLWPAMFTAQPNIHQFNPYRFMFPNFPGAAGFPGGFPPNPNAAVVPPPLLNGGLHPTKLFSASTMVDGLNNLPNNMNSVANLHLSRSHSPSNNRGSPPNLSSIRNRVTPIVPPSSSLTLTPPISHHGSDDPTTILPLQKLRNIPLQEKPIDLSAKSTNNNQVEYHEKMFTRLNADDISDGDDDDNIMCDSDNNERDYNSDDVDMKNGTKSDYDDSDRDDETVEDLSRSNNNNIIITNNKSSGFARRSSGASSTSPSSSPPRASTPLDLTRASSAGSSNSSPPLTKIAT